MKKIFVNGTFDVLHPGHIDLLNYAKAQGDMLLVAIDSDCRVQELKGVDRPVCNQTIRSTTLQNLKCVDDVQIFNTEGELTQIIKEYQPHIMIVGSDYKNKTVIGSEYAGELQFYDRINQYSTTEILNNYSNRRSLCR